MRLFFGLSLPDEIRAAAGSLSRQISGCIPGRYALPENLHITLAFLGHVPQNRFDQACAILAAQAAAHPAPTLSLNGLSHFGRQQNGILILRVKSDPPLDTLHEALVRALLSAGLPAASGPFSPHITLARHAVVPDKLPASPALSFSLKEAHVFLSARDERCVLRYTPLYSTPFAPNRL